MCWIRETRRRSKHAAWFCLALLVGGCQNDDRSVQTYEIQKQVAAPAVATAPTEASEFHWISPLGWQPGRASTMRIASFSVPVAGALGDCSLIALSGDGGGMAANVNRWRAQIGLGPQQPEEVAAAATEIRSEVGTLSYFRLENPENPEGAMLVAMVQVADQTLFAKLTAPLEHLNKAEPSFLDFCRSIDRTRPHETTPPQGNST